MTQRYTGVLALTAALAAGCASRPAPGNRFVHKGSAGFYDVGGPTAAASPINEEAVERAKQEALTKRAAEKTAPLPSIEGRDPVLREALAALAALTSNPTPAAHVRVAEAYRRVGVEDLALDHYSDALRLNPRDIAALDGRARLWRDNELLGSALTDAHRARYHAPDSAEVHNTLGTILERRGLCRSALAEYRQALWLKPDAAWAQQNVTRLTTSCP